MFNEQQKSLSIRQLLDKLQQNNLINSDSIPQIVQHVKSNAANKIPLYLQGLVGFGGFFFSSFFISFLFAVGSLEQEKSLLIWSFIFIGTAIFLYRFILNQDENSLIYNFLLQTSFNFMAAGKIAFVVGCFMLFETSSYEIQWVITGAIGLITLLIYPIYPVMFDRLLSSFVTIMAISISILVSYDDNGEWQSLLLELFFTLQVVIIAVLCICKKSIKALQPLNYALIIAICAQIILWTLIPKEEAWLRHLAVNFSIIKIILAFALILLIGWIAGGVKQLQQEPLIIALLGAIALGFVSSAGIILAIILLLLGYAKYDRFIIALGIALLPLFLFFYYYDLELNLMNKSAILVASGFILLIGYFYIKFRQLEQIGE